MRYGLWTVRPRPGVVNGDGLERTTNTHGANGSRHRGCQWNLDGLELADRLGFDGVGVNEHHQNGYGFMASPNIMAAALARRSPGGSALMVLGNSLALYQPATRVAEEFAMLDVISNGRLAAGFPVGTSGFQVAQALYVVARLDIATHLEGGAMTIGELAAATGSQPDVLRRLVRALASVGVFRQLPNDAVESTALGATLSARGPESVRDAALFWMETHYLPFSELLHTIRTGEPAADRYYGQPFFDWIIKDPERIALLTGAVANVTNGLRAGMFDDYRLPEGEVVADLGGADGTVLLTLLAEEPDRRGIVFDLPEVVSRARELLARHAAADRIEVVAGDFFRSVPCADVSVLSYILHDWDDTSWRRILQVIRKAAAPGARLVVIEGVVPPDARPHLTKMIDLTMLAMLAGKERTADEYQELVSAAGFPVDRIVSTPSPYSVIEATVHH
jgi:O-methyltransferase/luciferase-like monooxygenase